MRLFQELLIVNRQLLKLRVFHQPPTTATHSPPLLGQLEQIEEPVLRHPEYSFCVGLVWILGFVYNITRAVSQNHANSPVKSKVRIKKGVANKLH